MLVGVIADTHGLLRPEVEARLSGVDRILHAGDIGDAEIVPRLKRVAPVVAVRGNVDVEAWARTYPDCVRLDIGGRKVLMLHDVAAMAADYSYGGIKVVVSGHTHRPKVEERAGVLFLNPGSAGPRRFRLPVTIAILMIKPAAVQAEIVSILA